MKKIIFLYILCITISAQGQAFFGQVETHIINSTVFKKERTIRVLLPIGYETEKSNYNVLYVIDGGWDARVDYIAGTVQFLNEYGSFPQTIVVGINSDDRTFEFTPKPVNKITQENWGDRKVGGAPLFQDFFKEEVFPLIKQKFRVTNFKGLVGHSLGGTFAIADLSNAAPLFNAYVATSPNLSFDNEAIILALESKLKKKNELNSFLYVSIGTEGDMENIFTPGVNRLDGLFNFKIPSELRYYKKTNQGLDHGTTPFVGTLEGLMKLGEQWSLSDARKQELLDSKQGFLVGLKSHYDGVSRWIGEDKNPNASDINNLGYFALNSDNSEEAIAVFSWGIELHPNDANLYDSKGEALEKSGETSLALEYFKKALSTLEKNKKDYDDENYTYYKGVYLENIDRVERP